MFARKAVQRLRQDQAATSAVEFALVAPAFLALLFGIVAFGWAINIVSNVNFAAERAGRAFSLKPTMSTTEIETAVKSQLGYLDQSALKVSIVYETLAGGYRVGYVTASYSFSVEVPMIGTYPIGYSSTVTVPLLGT